MKESASGVLRENAIDWKTSLKSIVMEQSLLSCILGIKIWKCAGQMGGWREYKIVTYDCNVPLLCNILFKSHVAKKQKNVKATETFQTEITNSCIMTYGIQVKNFKDDKGKWMTLPFEGNCLFKYTWIPNCLNCNLFKYTWIPNSRNIHCHHSIYIL